MAWKTLVKDDVLLEGFNPSEQADLTASAGADGLAPIVTAAVLEARSVTLTSGVDLPVDATQVPDSLRPHIIALARWRWLIAFPNLVQMQTDARKEAAEFAQELLKDVAEGDFPVEPPVPDEGTTPAGDWNSNVKIPMRMDTTRANV